MGDALAGDLVYIYSDIKAIRLELILNEILHKIQHENAGRLFAESQIKIVCTMLLGNDQGVTGVYGIFIKNGKNGCRFSNQFNGGTGIAKRTFQVVLSFELIEMPVFVYFTVFVPEYGSVIKDNIGLIGFFWWILWVRKPSCFRSRLTAMYAFPVGLTSRESSISTLACSSGIKTFKT